MASLSRFGAALRFIIVCALCGFASAAAAQNYPSHNIRIIVPFAAGGLNDTAARIIQPYLEKALKQSVVVENKPGASGILGATYTAKSPPDGYTLTMVASSHTVLPATTANLPYDAEKDFAPIILLGKNPLMFVVNANVPAKTIQEFVALAKSEPGKLNYATPGAATQTRLVAELWSLRAGIKMQHVPYTGGAPAILSVVAGQTQFTVLSPLVSGPQIAAGKVRALAVGSLTRDPQYPDVPTLAESGFPGFEAIQWVGLLAPAGTPKPIVDRINAEVNKALKDPAMIKQLAQQGMLPAGGTPESFRALIHTEVANWKEAAHAAGIKPE
ncbi:MAG TPA: tripartite tricarboxylate transporter substrate binding protein [Xanthobacteraceae bacterium]|nr:tripartite tricarboxylate transporter substrate binding protein [Xanthobacteraceae bacterium]